MNSKIEECEIVSDLLGLVSVNCPAQEVMKWTKANRGLAEHWAAKVHLRASDNPVRVPKKPEFLNKYPEIAYEQGTVGRKSRKSAKHHQS